MTQPWQDPYQRRPVDIDAYAPPKRGGGGWWIALVAVVLVGGVLAALFLRPAAPAPTPAPTPTPAASSDASGPGMPFTLPDQQSRGRWEVVSHTWSDSGLTARVRISSEAGRVTYAFVAFSNQGTQVYEPETGAPDPEIGSGRLTSGETIEGNVFIPMPRGPATLILTTQAGRQVSALPISG